MIGIGLLAGSVAGCNSSEGGGLGQMLGVGNEEAPAPPPPKPKPTATPTPVPTTAPVKVVDDGALRRNVAFDQIRSRGISEVYEGKTMTAVKTFHGALDRKPDDVSVKLWLAAIKKSVERPRDAAPQASNEFQDVSRQLRGAQGGVVAPGMAPGGQAPGMAPGMAPGAGGAAAAPAGFAGGRTGGVAGAPAPAATPISVDPRAVF